jgi:carbon monoxide dehydrogenase subunit G
VMQRTTNWKMIGKGQDVKGRGSASMKMTARARSLENGGTEVNSLAEINVIGILAQMGARMINEVSNIMFAKFIKNFKAQLERPTDAAPEEAKPVNAASLAWAAAKGAFHRGDS